MGPTPTVNVDGRGAVTLVRPPQRRGRPAPYQLELMAQPMWSHREAAGSGFGSELSPDLTTPDEWGGFWFRNVRTYQCTSEQDPLCTALADAAPGQAPRR